MRHAIRGVLISLTLVVASAASVEAEGILVTPALFASGRDLWCVATNFAPTPQTVTAQIISNGVLRTPNNATCDDGPVAAGLSCFAQVFDAGGGATLCLFVVNSKKVIGSAQIMDAGQLLSVVPAVRRP